jgi:hypothetical protein
MLGKWPTAHADEVRRLFPTCYAFPSWQELVPALIPKEVDVLLCAGDAILLTSGWWDASVHTIIFGGTSGAFVQYSGQVCLKVIKDRCRSEQHDVMPVPPILEGPLREWLAAFQDSRGMPLIADGWPNVNFHSGFTVWSRGHSTTWSSLWIQSRALGVPPCAMCDQTSWRARLTRLFPKKLGTRSGRSRGHRNAQTTPDRTGSRLPTTLPAPSKSKKLLATNSLSASGGSARWNLLSLNRGTRARIAVFVFSRTAMRLCPSLVWHRTISLPACVGRSGIAGSTCRRGPCFEILPMPICGHHLGHFAVHIQR